MPADADRAVELRLAGALRDAYTIEGEIGRGGMGIVYRARDEKLKRPVAIKVLPPELAYRPEIRARFMREAETAARLSHPNIVPIHTVGEADDLVFFVMGYVDGESVAARLKRRGRLSVDETRRITRETADALATAHQEGVIHRDVKPDNILLEGTRARVMVTDFGIAKALTDTGGTLTGTGIAIGTPAFMSPEQAAGEREIDGRSDIYSLGVVAYLMLCGELPFSAPSVPALLMKQIAERPAPVDRRRPETPANLSATIMRCLEKDPADRWPTADALRRALETGTFPPLSPARRPLAREPEAVRTPLPRGRRAERRPEWRAEPLERRAEREGEHEEAPALTGRAGEPSIVRRFRGHLASFVAVNGGLMFLNLLTTQMDPPWFIVPAGFWFAFALAPQYARLWLAGYSWRDVINRPPAPDALEATAGGRALAPGPSALEEFGEQQAAVEQARADRAAILSIIQRLPKSERKMLPEVVPTVDQLLERAIRLARNLHQLRRDIDADSLAKLDERIAALREGSHAPERDRRLTLLERQRQTVADLIGRRDVLASQLEACLLAMQNVRFDLLRLRSAGVAEALGDLTLATRQARALSRDVDAAIDAAAEVRRVVGRDRTDQG